VNAIGLFAPSAPALVLALALDVFVGEYPNSVHPVVAMGKVIAWLESKAPEGKHAELAYGAMMAVVVPALFVGVAALVLRLTEPLPYLRIVVEALLLKSMFAMRALAGAARRVQRALERHAVDEARSGLRHLCSREPSTLTPEEVAAAAVESVAENASDSFVAPLFFYVLFGLEGAVAYRAINTQDAMIGYHGDYEWLGKAAARLDDVVNLVPARLTALMLFVAGGFWGGDLRGALKVWWRDAHRTESPNAGQPMAVMAGLLRVQLTKKKAYSLGDRKRPVRSVTISQAVRIMLSASVLAAAAALVLLGSGRAPTF
jgi:adenosylcobinamide-phosphate synthase